MEFGCRVLWSFLCRSTTAASHCSRKVSFFRFFRSYSSIRLRFPSGHATATVISVLHDKTHSEVSAELAWETKIKALLYSFVFSSIYVRFLDQPLITDHNILFSTGPFVIA